MKSLSHTAAKHLLSGNLATQDTTSGCNEANSISLSSFLPQRDENLIKAQERKDLISRNELGHNIQDSHKSKQGTTIRRLGYLATLNDVLSTMINLKAILSALIVVTAGGPQPILLQLLDKVIRIINNPDTQTWVLENFTCMQHLFVHVFSFVDRSVTLVFCGALNFNNVNVVTFERPLTEFDLTDYKKAVAVYKALHDQFNLHQSQNTPITVSPSVVIRYTQVCNNPPPPQQANGTPGQAIQPRPPAAAAAAAPKRGAAADKKNNDDAPKKPRVAPSFNPSQPIRFEKKKMGLFYTNAKATVGGFFPAGLTEQICMQFACKGFECTAENCTRKHHRYPEDLAAADVLAIGKHLLATKQGWLDVYHWKKVTIPEAIAGIVGAEDGPRVSKKN